MATVTVTETVGPRFMAATSHAELYTSCIEGEGGCVKTLTLEVTLLNVGSESIMVRPWEVMLLAFGVSTMPMLTDPTTEVLIEPGETAELRLTYRVEDPATLLRYIESDGRIEALIPYNGPAGATVGEARIPLNIEEVGWRLVQV